MNDIGAVVLLPGLGADERLLAPQRRVVQDLEVPRWIPPLAGESLPEYATRLAATVRARRPLVLGGVSLGGMLAYEMARHLRPAAVVQIASCRSGASVRPTMLWFRFVARRFPPWALRGVQWLSPLLAGAAIGADRAQRRMCVAMFRDADVHFIRWAVPAILAWRPDALPGIPVASIHGARDRLIPAAGVAADEMVRDGGHLINLTHAEAVNRFLAKAMETARRARGLGS